MALYVCPGASDGTSTLYKMSGCHKKVKKQSTTARFESWWADKHELPETDSEMKKRGSHSIPRAHFVFHGNEMIHTEGCCMPSGSRRSPSEALSMIHARFSGARWATCVHHTLTSPREKAVGGVLELVCFPRFFVPTPFCKSWAEHPPSYRFSIC